MFVIRINLFIFYSMPSPTGNRTPGREPLHTPRERGDGSETPIREEIPETPTTETPSRRRAETPRQDGSLMKSLASSSRTPRKRGATPARSVTSSVDTPMRWGASRRDTDAGSEIPASPAHSLAPTSPGTGTLLSMYSYKKIYVCYFSSGNE